jgi:hypothetical protein
MYIWLLVVALFLALLWHLDLDFFLAGAGFPLLGGFLSAVGIHVLGILDEMVQLCHMIWKRILCQLPNESRNPEDPEEFVTNGLCLAAQLFVYEVEDEG